MSAMLAGMLCPCCDRALGPATSFHLDRMVFDGDLYCPPCGWVIMPGLLTVLNRPGWRRVIACPTHLRPQRRVRCAYVLPVLDVGAGLEIYLAATMQRRQQTKLALQELADAATRADALLCRPGG